MKKSRFTDSPILAILKQAEDGVPAPELCRQHGMSSESFYKWRSKYGRYERVPDAPAQGAGAERQSPEEGVRGCPATGGGCAGSFAKKW